MGKYRNGNKTQPIGIIDSYAFREDGRAPTFPEGLKALEHGAEDRRLANFKDCRGSHGIVWPQP
jgi:hypothetical protein